MLLLAGCAAGGAPESGAAEKTGVVSTPEEEQRVTSGGENTAAPLSQSEGIFDLEKRTVLLNSGYEMPTSEDLWGSLSTGDDYSTPVHKPPQRSLHSLLTSGKQQLPHKVSSKYREKPLR